MDYCQSMISKEDEFPEVFIVIELLVVDGKLVMPSGVPELNIHVQCINNP